MVVRIALRLSSTHTSVIGLELLSMLTPSSALGETTGGLIGEKVKDDAVIEHGGIEITASNDGEDCSASVVYPHFSDRPGASVNAHTLHPALGETTGGLIGEKVKDDAVIEHGGIEIIASNDGENCSAYVVYPHFSDRPGASVNAHTLYSALGETVGGLIGEKVKDDAVIEH